MVKLNLNFGKTQPGITSESKKLHAFGNELVQFASENHEKIRKFCKKVDAVQNENITKLSFKIIEKTMEILNQFVILVEHQHHDNQIVKSLVQNLGIFLMLIGAQVNIGSAIMFTVLNHRFYTCKNAEKLGSVAVNLTDCLQFQEQRLARLESRILEAAEWMFRIGRAMQDPTENVETSFKQLQQHVQLVKTDSAECDEKVNETFAKIRKTLITPEKRTKIIRITTIVGGTIGLLIAILCTWYAGWGVALVGILIGTTGSAIVGAVFGFMIVNRRDTNLLEELLKCSNQRDHLQKNFETFKFRLQNSECFLKYANEEHIEIEMSAMTGSEC